ncbi:MAG: hypothetical protein ACE5OZ_16215 [Candidatus Heimdallarchaeota archaeon]
MLSQRKSTILLAVLMLIGAVLTNSEKNVQAFSGTPESLSSIENNDEPLIKNTTFSPENITTQTESVLVRATIIDFDGIKWARVFACVNLELCLLPQEMAKESDGWEANVRLLFQMVPGDYVGFNISAQDALGSESTLYISKIVKTTQDDGAFLEGNESSTRDTAVAVWGSFIGMLMIGTKLSQRRRAELLSNSESYG